MQLSRVTDTSDTTQGSCPDSVGLAPLTQKQGLTDSMERNGLDHALPMRGVGIYSTWGQWLQELWRMHCSHVLSS